LQRAVVGEDANLERGGDGARQSACHDANDDVDDDRTSCDAELNSGEGDARG